MRTLAVFEALLHERVVDVRLDLEVFEVLAHAPKLLLPVLLRGRTLRRSLLQTLYTRPLRFNLRNLLLAVLTE